MEMEYKKVNEKTTFETFDFIESLILHYIQKKIATITLNE